MWRSTRNFVFITLLVLVAAFMLPVEVGAQMPGAIWTTDVSLTVDRNIYYNKCDVYLNGGPIKQNQPGLPDGDYYYKVTDPSGAVDLSENVKPLTDRLVTVVNGKFSGVQLCPFEDTPNPGGEYKVWLTSVDNYNLYGGFIPEWCKTDNFKVKGGEVPPPPELRGAIGGFKYYDADVDGEMDPTEVTISCWLIELYEDSVSPGNLIASTFTDCTGAFSFSELAAGTYIVREVMPVCPCWIQTGPKDSSVDIDPLPDVEVTAQGGVYTVVLLDNDAVASDVNFGNVCLGGGGGHTLGYWSNKNGQRDIDANWATINAPGGMLYCSLLQGLPNTRPSAPYLTSKTEIKTFLLSANAVDMRYMLAAQWLAMKLNIACGYVNPSSLVWTGSGFMSIGAVCDAVCANWSSWDRATQEMYKNILDDANNNKNFVQPGPTCPIQYGPEYDSIPRPPCCL